jgi:Caspase domain
MSASSLRARILAMAIAALVLTLLLVLALERPANADGPRPMRRVAVIVGANDPAPGRQPLRYAHSDAQLMADVLERVGRFARADIQVLLEPHPGDIQTALDRAARDVQASGADALLFFYYSGHSDGQQVFPHGEALALSDLRDRIARSSARVRVALLDTCRGGSWTRTKGLSVGPPLDPLDLASFATEGTALLSSSSGLENAHEAAEMKGSFFTHHVAAGLLGAADKSGDGNVTLQEVFDYAKERTVRDSARMAATTQHPSFDVQLRGRQDIVLGHVATSTSALVLQQVNALEVIHLASGVTVAETPSGQQQLRLALVPGRYLVRRVADGRVYSKEVDVPSGATVALAEEQLQVTGNERLALKDAAPIEVADSVHSLPAKKRVEARIGLGVSTGTQRSFGSGLYGLKVGPTKTLERSFTSAFSFTYGITDRLSWSLPVPAFAYRFGTDGRFEVIPRGGLTSIGYSSTEGVIGTLDTGFATRAWLTPSFSLISNAATSWGFGIKTADSHLNTGRGDMLGLQASLGIMANVGERVTLALGAGVYGCARVRDSSGPASLLVNTSSELVFGAVQTLGYRPLPLIQVHLTRKLSIDGYVSMAVDLRSGDLRDRYMLGLTSQF